MFTAVIPLLDCFLAAYFVFLRFRLTLRESCLVSATLATGWLVLGTESLSLAHALAFWPVLLWWLAPLPVLAFLVFDDFHGRKFPRWPRLEIFDYALLTGIIFVLGWSLCQAIFSPPNNADSQEYHLQRQVFWMQQQSVEHFATSNLRQVAMPPLTEFAGLHLMILTGGDRWHNLVQWFAFVLALSAVSLTTRKFNRSPTPQLLAAFWTATIPLAFLQASNTKNDVVVMMWICILAYWVLLLDTKSRLRLAHIFLIGIAFGALMLTKGTGPVFGFPIATFAAIYLLRRHLRLAIPALTIIAIIALLMNVGHFTRNYRAFQSVAPDKDGIQAGPPLGEEDHSLSALISNMSRNLAPHFVTPSDTWNTNLTKFIYAFHEKIGRDMNDPKTTWMPLGKFRPYQFSWQKDEDKAAAPAHMLLLLLLPIAIILAWRQLPWRAIAPLLVMFFVGFVLFSFLLKWQNWHVRLIIALPALIAPVFAWCYGTSRMRFVAPFAALFLFVTLTPSLNNFQRPLFDDPLRTFGKKSVFHEDPFVMRCYYHPDTWPEEYRELANRLAELHPQTVAFFTGGRSPDYPMQRLLLDQLSPASVFTAFNATLEIPGKPEPDPDALLVANSKAKQLQHKTSGTWYVPDKQFGRYTLFLKQDF
jgi:Dolichyl-phosphate-mannose-protein mannosyltransferase